MSLPLIASKTYESLKVNLEVRNIVKNFIKRISSHKDPVERAKFVHTKINQSIDMLFEDEAVQKHVTCKKGCTACCHTQVSVTEGEAKLLSKYIKKIPNFDWHKLEKQADAKNSGNLFFKIPYDQRGCVFLDEEGSCSVYEDRPSVCRSNHAVSDAKLCETKDGVSSKIRLLKTVTADLMIYAYFKYSRSNGSLPYMLSKELRQKKTKNLIDL
jgi:Fe-S-cluster containining protein